MAMEVDLTGRRVLVTGGGQGVGRGIALGFAAAGAEVVVNDLRAERAAAVVDEVEAAGGKAVSSVFDVTAYAAVAEAVEALGGVDVLVNNAGNAGGEGFGNLAPFAETDPADWEPYLRVNLYGAMHCARAVLPGMVAGGWGRIVTIVSDAGRTGDAYMAAYSAAKAGAAGLTRALAIETGRHGITVNNISLGTMRTPMTEVLWSDPDNSQAKALMQRYVVRRPGSPDDVAALAVFLASPQASWITGQTYPLNGGYSFAL
jgi:NAD(P)-dependent dehydrogenase (short-subunit alcohol dehydrogenase family)